MASEHEVIYEHGNDGRVWVTLIYDDYSPETCYLHCEQGWLPSKGTEDSIVEEAGNNYWELPLLLPPYELVACPACAVGYNSDLACDPAAVERAVAVTMADRPPSPSVELPESPNKFLRRVLSAGGAFEAERVNDLQNGDCITPDGKVVRPYVDLSRRSRKPLLKPKERK